MSFGRASALSGHFRFGAHRRVGRAAFRAEREDRTRSGPDHPFAAEAGALGAAEAHALVAAAARSGVRALPIDSRAQTISEGRVRTVSRAFTLVEILLVLALLALFAAVFIPGVNSILDQMNDRSPDQLLNEAVLAARTEALESSRPVELRYDTEKRQLVHGAAEVRSDVLPLGATLELLPMQAGSSILLGGELTEAQEPLKRVRFFSDGTCEPFRLRVKLNADAKPRVFVVDPWTCALSPAPAKGGA